MRLDIDELGELFNQEDPDEDIPLENKDAEDDFVGSDGSPSAHTEQGAFHLYPGIHAQGKSSISLWEHQMRNKLESHGIYTDPIDEKRTHEPVTVSVVRRTNWADRDRLDTERGVTVIHPVAVVPRSGYVYTSELIDHVSLLKPETPGINPQLLTITIDKDWMGTPEKAQAICDEINDDFLPDPEQDNFMDSYAADNENRGLHLTPDDIEELNRGKIDYDQIDQETKFKKEDNHGS
jgi:hypothetical protein